MHQVLVQQLNFDRTLRISAITDALAPLDWAANRRVHVTGPVLRRRDDPDSPKLLAPSVARPRVAGLRTTITYNGQRGAAASARGGGGSVQAVDELDSAKRGGHSWWDHNKARPTVKVATHCNAVLAHTIGWS